MTAEAPQPPIELFRAIERGDVAGTALLLAAGANPRAPDVQGVTPLMVAALGTDVTIVHALVAAGADVDRQAADGSTALMKAALWGRVDVLVALLRLGADPSLVDAEGWTAAQTARARGHDGIAQLLAAWEPKRQRESGNHRP